MGIFILALFAAVILFLLTVVFTEQLRTAIITGSEAVAAK